MKTKTKDLIAAVALVASSALGPSFLIQTTVFTEKLIYNFGFVILLSILIDIVAQVTVWKTLSFANISLFNLSNNLLKGLGSVISIFIAFGGFIFTIGNLAGTGMGLNSMFELPNTQGIIISSVIIALLFFFKNVLRKLDQIMQILSLSMIFVLILMLFKADINWTKTFTSTLFPSKIDIKATITLVGATVGGYITFAGAQKLIDAGIVGKDYAAVVQKSAYSGLLFTGIFRYLLFIAVLSVAITGGFLKPENPIETIFTHYLGSWGKPLIGAMIWAASTTAVIASVSASLSFLKSINSNFETHSKWWALGFIALSLLINIAIQNPITLIVFAGYFNAFVLPIGLIVVLLSLRKVSKFKGIKIPLLFEILAWSIVAVLFYFIVTSTTL